MCWTCINCCSVLVLNCCIILFDCKNLCVGWVEVGRVGHGRVRQPTGMDMQEQVGAGME